MRRAILVTALALLPVLGCRPRPPAPKLHTITLAERTEGYLWNVQYGYYTEGKLEFVVFAGKRTPNDGVTGLVKPGSRETWLEKPDGTRLKLPADEQLYECVDGIFRQSKERVRWDEFQAFLASHPDQYTITALLRFVSTLRKGKEERQRD